MDGPENVSNPASDAADVRLFIFAMKAFNSYIMQGDYSSAFLTNRLNNRVYLVLSEGHPQRVPDNTFFYECGAGLYGLAVSGCACYLYFVQELEKYGLKRTSRSPYLFIDTRKRYVYNSMSTISSLPR